jgi:hypothetical protein
VIVLATIVDTKALWQTVVAASIAGIGATFLFSLGILGVARFVDASRDGRRGAAALSAALAVLAMLGVAAAIVVGVIVMTTKS